RLDAAARLGLAVALGAVAGFVTIGPYSFLAGAISLDLGGKRGSAMAAGLIDGTGYLGGVLAGGGIARLSTQFGWSKTFIALAIVAAATALAAPAHLALRRRRLTRAEVAPELAGDESRGAEPGGGGWGNGRPSVRLRLAPGRARRPPLGIGAKQRVVVVAVRRHPSERLRLGELVVEHPATGVGRLGRRRRMHRVAVVER